LKKAAESYESEQELRNIWDTFIATSMNDKYGLIEAYYQPINSSYSSPNIKINQIRKSEYDMFE